jgi:hypothetical protein
MSDTAKDTPVVHFVILAAFIAVMLLGGVANDRLRAGSAACVQSGGIFVKTVEGFRCLTR